MLYKLIITNKWWKLLSASTICTFDAIQQPIYALVVQYLVYVDAGHPLMHYTVTKSANSYILSRTRDVQY